MGKVESDSLKEYLPGRGERPRALIGRKDPRRTPGGTPSDKPPWEVLGWDSSKGDKPCPGCGDGKDWWTSCPTFPKPNKNLTRTRLSLVSAKKIAKAKKAKAAAAAAADANDDEASRAPRANVARMEQSEFTPIKDILAGYIGDNSTRSMVARMNLSGKPPPDAPPSPPDLHYDSSSNYDEQPHSVSQLAKMMMIRTRLFMGHRLRRPKTNPLHRQIITRHVHSPDACAPPSSHLITSCTSAAAGPTLRPSSY
jgi:hypothetical protein